MKNDELISRRELFRKCTKSILPAIAVLAISSPVVAAIIDVSPKDCHGSCVNTCMTTCGKDSCGNQCYGLCYGNCKNACKDDCGSSCGGKCKSSCYGNCKLACSGTCRGMCGEDGCGGGCLSTCSYLATSTKSEDIVTIINAINDKETCWTGNCRRKK